MTRLIETERTKKMGDTPAGISPAEMRRRRSRKRGQGLVEFALVSPILVFMLVATLDFARAYSAYIEVTNSARAGAIYGSRGSMNAHDTTRVRDAALADSPTIFGSSPTVTSSTSTDSDGYEQITVTVNYTFTPLFTMPGIPNSIGMSRSVQMRVVG